jgi:hypothetical protein
LPEEAFNYLVLPHSVVLIFRDNLDENGAVRVGGRK